MEGYAVIQDLSTGLRRFHQYQLTQSKCEVRYPWGTFREAIKEFQTRPSDRSSR